MLSLPITREQAIELLKKFPQEEYDMIHYLESEAIMRGLAEKFGEDADYWGMLGLLHDVDWAETKKNIPEHIEVAKEILKDAGFDENFISAIVSHGYGYEEKPKDLDKKRTRKIEHALAAAETVTGLVHAYALMRGKKISDMDAKGLKKKFKEKSFASKIRRDIIKECEDIGLELGEFFEVAIDSIKKIAKKVGLK
ncbi:MAG: HDIG domain-containing protein [Nanoarchaeota archaeon]|nr:HDIG domain-containing protein [Nanoarchaeota archaeon]